jgi:hypothetical protein
MAHALDREHSSAWANIGRPRSEIEISAGSFPEAIRALSPNQQGHRRWNFRAINLKAAEALGLIATPRYHSENEPNASAFSDLLPNCHISQTCRPLRSSMSFGIS